MGGCVVMMKLLNWPQIRSFLSHSVTKSADDLQAVFLGNVFAIFSYDLYEGYQYTQEIAVVAIVLEDACNSVNYERLV